MPKIEGFLNLQNPEVDDGVSLPDGYGIEDIARVHTETILQSSPNNDEFYVMGMSLGGMVASVLASKFRSKLPKRTKFYFLVTSANTSSCPAITQEMLKAWKSVRPGDIVGMETILSPFFSEEFLKFHYIEAKKYFLYRANGLNRQSPKAFMKQVAAVMSYDGPSYYKELDSFECVFIHGGADRVFDQRHHDELKKLCPEAQHRVVDGLGHMVNIEKPSLFRA